MFVWLTQSFFYALVFPYLVVILYVNDLQIFRFVMKQSFCQCCSIFASAKVKIIFFMTKCFFKNF